MDDQDNERERDPDRPGARSPQVRIVGAQQADPTMSIPAVPPGSAEAVVPEVGPEAAAPDGAPEDAMPETQSPDPGSGVDLGRAEDGSAEGADEPSAAELPHWTEAPTGEVPAVLRDDQSGEEQDPWSALPAPAWREEGADWDADTAFFEPSMLAEGEPGIRARGESEVAERQPWQFDLPDQARPARTRLPGDASGVEAAAGDDTTADEETLVTPIDALASHDPQPEVREVSPHSLERSGRPEHSGDDGPGQDGQSLADPAPGDVGVHERGTAAHQEGSGADLNLDREWLPTGLRRRRRRGAVAGSADAAQGPGHSDEPGEGAGGPTGEAAEPQEPPTDSGSSRRVHVGDVDEGAVALAGDDPTVAGDTGIVPPDRRGSRLRDQDRSRTPERRGPAVPGRGTTRVSRPDGPRHGPVRPRPVRSRPSAGEHAVAARDMTAAAATGVVLLLLVIVIVKLGNVLAAIGSTVVVFLAAAEAYAGFRRAGYQPATLLGLLASVSLMVAAYNKGLAALPLIVVLLVVFTLLWYMGGVQPAADPVLGAGSTLFVFCWVGVLGSFAGLLLSPNLFPHRHGLAFLMGAIVTSVACDVGSLVVGDRFGRHPLAPAISPNKTWEGVVGGAVFSILAAIIIVHFIHPWTLGKSVALGVLVAVVSPIGDLCESLVKRRLGVKDMGRLLPGHGGMLDRIDSLLFVLPATYYLVKAVHLG